MQAGWGDTCHADLVQQAVLQEVGHEVQGGELRPRLLQQRLGVRPDDAPDRVQLRWDTQDGVPSRLGPRRGR